MTSVSELTTATAQQLSAVEATALLAQVSAEQSRLAGLQGALLARLIETHPEHGDSAVADSGLLSLPEVAKLLAIPVSRAYELARRGGLPAVKVGKYVRVRRSAVDAFIGAGRVDGGLYQRYNGSHGRVRTSSAQKPGTTDSGRPRRSTRRRPEHGGTLGAGPATDHRADSAVDRPDIGEPKA
jgi:excisionase family DNA binding protein